ncbi:7858_t:CDS:1 [Dentiscutata erythropus]|uniref:7858_t:CDS:1 n=1 Tax=Dentiscutata erythropus TaxID=1348616 RepID=A0A9N8ZQP2_9GLOM|nr:7858_t:CDS:1 [Dentiscutata erythropus]
MSTIAGVMSFLDQEKFKNTQGFQDVSFLIKVEKSEDEEKTAELYFLDGDSVMKIQVPDDIECKKINELDQKKIKKPFRNSNIFLINHPKKYNILFKKKRIYALIPEQKCYTIHNFNKPDNLKQYKLEKRVNKALNVIIKLENN